MKARGVITDLRRRTLGELAEFHYLSTPQFYQVLEADSESARRGIRRMLLLLTRACLVLRSRYTIDNPADTFLRYQYCYRLSRAGLAAVGVRSGTLEKAPASLAHEIQITDFHLRLAAETAKRPTHRLYWEQTNLRRTVNPDALFAITDTAKPAAESTFYYFLEIERLRQGHYRNGVSALQVKLQRYAAYRRTEQCQTEWRYFSDFRVIVVVGTEERRGNILRALAKTVPQRFIWVTTLDAIHRMIGEPIFRAPPEPDSAYSLFAQHTWIRRAEP